MELIKVSQGLKKEFEELRASDISTLFGVMDFVANFSPYYPLTHLFLFKNGAEKNNENQLLFAKWWGGAEVEEETK